MVKPRWEVELTVVLRELVSEIMRINVSFYELLHTGVSQRQRFHFHCRKSQLRVRFSNHERPELGTGFPRGHQQSCISDAEA